MEAALVEMLERIMSGDHDPISAIVEAETARGFKVLRPGDAPWFRAADWKYASIASINRKRVRLVLLHSFQSGKGAMTRTIEGIIAEGLTPSIIDPTPQLADTLRRRGWRCRSQGTTFEDFETVWYPRS